MNEHPWQDLLEDHGYNPAEFIHSPLINTGLNSNHDYQAIVFNIKQGRPNIINNLTLLTMGLENQDYGGGAYHRIMNFKGIIVE